MLPKIAIVGRPNVGKSSLLNMLAGRRISIVDPTAGVTRDRVATVVDLQSPGEAVSSSGVTIPRDAPPGGDPRYVEVIDTGGYGILDPSAHALTPQIERQIVRGLAEADLVLFVIDAQTGVTPLDRKVAQVLRSHKLPQAGPEAESATPKVRIRRADGHDPDLRSKTRSGPACNAPPVILVANKVDDQGFESQAWEVMKLGFGEPIMISAVTGHNKQALYRRIRENLDLERWRGAGRHHAPPDPGVLLAVLGKRNAGKSTLVNALAGDERVIVSEHAGTTRDAVDVRFEIEPSPDSNEPPEVFTAIDTAGLRRSKSIQNDIEFYSTHRALRSIRRADICLLVIDAAVPMSHVDRQLVREILDHHRPTVLVVNKWDLAQREHTQEEYVEYLDKHIQDLAFAPIVFVSAQQGEGMREVLALVRNLREQALHRVSTAELNRAIEAVMSERGPSAKGGKQAKIYYATQLEVDPPTIGLFVNNPELFDHNYQRFLLNRLRDLLPFSEVPIKLLVRGKQHAPVV